MQTETVILNESQSMLRDAVGRYVQDKSGTLLASDAAQLNGVWSDFAEQLGILALPFPEDRGGLSCGPVETMIVMEQLGSALAAEPYLSTAVTAASLLNAADGHAATALIAQIAVGEAIVAAALGSGVSARLEDDEYVLDGTTSLVVCAPIADHLLLHVANAEGRQLLFCLPIKDVQADFEEFRLLDGSPAAKIGFAGARVPRDTLLIEDAADDIIFACDSARAAHCAELVGIVDRMLRDTVEYTKQRKQFGQALAGFQVLQHRMADMYVETELARSMALMAALAIAENGPGRQSSISAALARNLSAARTIAHSAVQLHGGIGTTSELALSRYVKRVRTLSSLLGGTDRHVANYAAASAP